MIVVIRMQMLKTTVVDDDDDDNDNDNDRHRPLLGSSYMYTLNPEYH